MAQYRQGTVTLTNGSRIVTGLNTGWATQLAKNQMFSVKGSGVFYQIASVDSDAQITLTSNYNGVTAAGAAYLVQRDFTPNQNFAIPAYGDTDTAALIAQTILQIDTLLASLSNFGAIYKGDITLQGSLSVDVTALPTIGDPAIVIGMIFVDGNGFIKRATKAGGQ